MIRTFRLYEVWFFIDLESCSHSLTVLKRIVWPVGKIYLDIFLLGIRRGII